MQRAARHARLVVAALGAAAGVAACAHAPAAARPDALYPPPPAPALARYLDAIPGGAFAPSTRSALRRFAEAVAGVDAAQEPALFDLPFGLATGPGDQLVVADPDRPQVLRLDLGRNEARPVICAEHAWVAPVAATFDPAGLLLVADAGAALLVRIDPAGTCALLGRGELERPTGVAALGERIYAADPPRHTVLVLSRDGAVLARLGDGETSEGSLHFPSALAVTPAGDLLVVDTLNFRVVRFAADGRFLGTFGSADQAEGGLARPKAVAVDGLGRAFVSDAELGVVVVYDATGRYLFSLGAPGDGPTDLSIPGGLAVRGRSLYVADGPHRRIQVYELLGERS
jgi:sugar lactone lactonase YvrE